MATPLTQTLEREISTDDGTIIVSLSGEGIALRVKRGRRSLVLPWDDVARTAATRAGTLFIPHGLSVVEVVRRHAR